MDGRMDGDSTADLCTIWRSRVARPACRIGIEDWLRGPAPLPAERGRLTNAALGIPILKYSRYNDIIQIHSFHLLKQLTSLSGYQNIDTIPPIRLHLRISLSLSLSLSLPLFLSGSFQDSSSFFFSNKRNSDPEIFRLQWHHSNFRFTYWRILRIVFFISLRIFFLLEGSFKGSLTGFQRFFGIFIIT